MDLTIAARHLEALVLIVAADGQMPSAERRQFEITLASYPKTSGLTNDQLNVMIDDSLDRLTKEGCDARIAAIGQVITDPEERRVLLQTLVMLAASDLDAAPEELQVLQSFQNAFQISAEEFAKMLEQISKNI